MTTVLHPSDLKRGDRIEDGSSIGLVVKKIVIADHDGIATITDLHGWQHRMGLADDVTVRLPRQSGLELLT